ncbi:MAG: class B sortase [Clostridia bacterium]
MDYIDYNQKSDTKKTILIIGAIVLAIILITFGLISYFTTHKKDLGSKTPVGDINKAVVESKDEGRDLQKEISKLNFNYSDAKAWLKVPGTSIDFPIFQSTDNDRYLRQDRDNNKTKWGETFLDYRSNINNMNSMSHFIIYGHNTEVDSHFTPLLNYKKKEFFNNHKIIEMSTLNGNYRWQIFSAYVTDVEFFYIDTNFADTNEYNEYLTTVKGMSMYNTNTQVLSTDTILTLSTCDYTRQNGRFVVQAKLIKE